MKKRLAVPLLLLLGALIATAASQPVEIPPEDDQEFFKPYVGMPVIFKDGQDVHHSARVSRVLLSDPGLVNLHVDVQDDVRPVLLVRFVSRVGEAQHQQGPVGGCWWPQDWLG
ncbi:hypothetical protein [Deinococcus aquatilis]|uniref:hypothetical protein n=1 Tax=Deinococcus aquatilis TaxID=519440 RepID=UPI000368E7D9|nr:hypothetical protein [Deinococcus aquatilis]